MAPRLIKKLTRKLCLSPKLIFDLKQDSEWHRLALKRIKNLIDCEWTRKREKRTCEILLARMAYHLRKILGSASSSQHPVLLSAFGFAVQNAFQSDTNPKGHAAEFIHYASELQIFNRKYPLAESEKVSPSAIELYLNALQQLGTFQCPRTNKQGIPTAGIQATVYQALSGLETGMSETEEENEANQNFSELETVIPEPNETHRNRTNSSYSNFENARSNYNAFENARYNNLNTSNASNNVPQQQPVPNTAQQQSQLNSSSIMNVDQTISAVKQVIKIPFGFGFLVRKFENSLKMLIEARNDALTVFRENRSQEEKTAALRKLNDANQAFFALELWGKTIQQYFAEMGLKNSPESGILRTFNELSNNLKNQTNDSGIQFISFFTQETLVTMIRSMKRMMKTGGTRRTQRTRRVRRKSQRRQTRRH